MLQSFLSQNPAVKSSCISIHQVLMLSPLHLVVWLCKNLFDFWICFLLYSSPKWTRSHSGSSIFQNFRILFAALNSYGNASFNFLHTRTPTQSQRSCTPCWWRSRCRCSIPRPVWILSVDFSASLLKVTGKRNKQRLIPFGDELKELMLEYINVRNETIPERSEAFFVKEDGERLYKNLVYNLVKRNLSKVATLKKKSPHVLRHTFATTMLNNEAELGVVKELLGHESITTTEIYTHATFEELKKVYKQAHPRA